MKSAGKLGLLSASMLVGLGTSATLALAQDNTTQQNPPPQAQAQTPDQSSDQATADQEIVVTGSRIRHDNFNSTSPIQVITRDESVRAGLASTTELLQSTATTGGSAQLNNLFGGFVVNGGAGVNSLGLRGFGATDTLILLNGRRLTPAGTTGSVGAVDLNVIPTALVDRVEVLKDGASSVYGSDAVAGVVNIITNQNLDRLVIEGQRNITEAGGGDQSLLSISAGHRFGDRLTLTGSAEYFDRSPLTYGQRDFASCPRDLLRDPATGAVLDDINQQTGQPKCFTPNFRSSAGVTINTLGTGATHGLPGAGATGATFTRWRPNSGIADGIGGNLDGFEGVNGGGQLLGFQNRDSGDNDPRLLDQYLLTPTRNTNVFLQAKYDLGGGNELYGEALYSDRISKNNNYIQLSLDYPNNALILNADLASRAPFQVASVFPNPPPVGQAGANMPGAYVTQARAFIGVGNETASQEVKYQRYLFGARGDLNFLQGWRYDANVYYGDNNSTNTNPNFLTDRIYNSLVVTTTIPVGTPANLTRTLQNGVRVMCQITATNPAYGCIPAPALSTQTIQGQFPSDWLNFVLNNQVETTKYKETTESISIDGPLFNLQGGPVQVVLGAEHRSNSIDDEPSAAAVQQDLLAFSAGLPTRGSDAVTEEYAEVEFPVLRDAPFAHSLTLNISGRHTDYRSYGAGNTHKYSASWEPVDGLMFRATEGTSFRAPALFEQFLGAVTGFEQANVDPCDQYGTFADHTTNLYKNCDAQIHNTAFQQLNGLTIFNGGGAANHLGPETSKNRTLGLTFHMLRNADGIGDFSFAADNFAITLNNAVTQIGDFNILDKCYNSPNLSDPLCALVVRDSQNRLIVNNNFTNIAEQKSQGWDFGARYRHTLMGGQLTVVANMTEYTKQAFALFPTDGETDNNNSLGAPRLSGDLTVEYDRGPWDLHWGVDWIDAMSDYAVNGEPDPTTSIEQLAAPNYFLHNVSVTYNADRWTATFGVRNLFDRSPPLISSTDNNTAINGWGDLPLYSGLDYFGRTFFVNLSAKF